MDGTTRGRPRARRRAAALALAAALLTGCGLAPSPIEVAAATAPAPRLPEVVAPPPAMAPDLATIAADAAARRDVVPPALTPRPTIELPLIPMPETLASPVLPPPPYGVSPATEPLPAPCGGFSSPRRVVPGVEVGPGQATLTWQAGGRASVLSYRVTAVSQQLVTGEQPAPLQVLAAAPDDCQQLAVTIGGLAAGVPYVFWMEEETYDATRDVTSFVQVGSTEGVVIG